MSSTVVALLLLIPSAAAASSPLPLGEGRCERAVPAALELQASTRAPVVGQEVEILLTLRIKPELVERWVQAARRQQFDDLPELNLPWFRWEIETEPEHPAFSRGFVWLLPPDNWFCVRTKEAAGLPLRVRSWPGVVWCAPVADSDGEFLLSWRILVTEYRPELLGRINFRFAELVGAGVEARSDDLRLVLARLPMLPRDAPDLELGVGPYQVSAALDRRRTRVNEPVLLTLRIGGPGNLTHLQRPNLARLEGFDRVRRLAVEPAGETWESRGAVRCFRYRLTPRSLALQAVPEIACVFWEPAADGTGQYRIVRLPPMPLEVLPPEDRPRIDETPAFAPGQVPRTLRLVPAHDSLLRRENAWPENWILWGLAAGLPAVWLLLFVGQRWLAARWLGVPLLSQAAATALHELRSERPSPAHAAEVVSCTLASYLHARFHLSVAEPTAAEVEAALAQSNVPASIRAEAEELVERCAACRFAPEAGISAKLLIADAERLIRRLDGAA